VTTTDGVLRHAHDRATPIWCGSVQCCHLAAERELLISVVELASNPDILLSKLVDLVCARLAVTLNLDRAFVLLVERAGAVTSGPASLRLAGRYPNTAHGPMASETRAARRVLSSGLAEASWSKSASWLAAPIRGSLGVLGVLVAASGNGNCYIEEHAEVLQAINRQLAQAIERDTRAEEQSVNDRSAAAIRRVLEEGSAASTVREAGTILAQVAADAFHCERAGMYAVDKNGVISFTVGVGAPRRSATPWPQRS
jgi:hypothetical protein